MKQRGREIERERKKREYSFLIPAVVQEGSQQICYTLASGTFRTTFQIGPFEPEHKNENKSHKNENTKHKMNLITYLALVKRKSKEFEPETKVT